MTLSALISGGEIKLLTQGCSPFPVSGVRLKQDSDRTADVLECL